MNTLTIESWCKRSGEEQSSPAGNMQFYVSEPTHLLLEQAEERLQKSKAAHAEDATRGYEGEIMVDADMDTLALVLPEGFGPLSDCKFRVYLSTSERGQFHLVGHQASDGSLIYSNAVMIDQLG